MGIPIWPFYCQYGRRHQIHAHYNSKVANRWESLPELANLDLAFSIPLPMEPLWKPRWKPVDNSRCLSRRAASGNSCCNPSWELLLSDRRTSSAAAHRWRAAQLSVFAVRISRASYDRGMRRTKWWQDRRDSDWTPAERALKGKQGDCYIKNGSHHSFTIVGEYVIGQMNVTRTLSLSFVR